MKTPPARRLGVSSSEAALPRLHRGGGSSTSTETGGFRLAADGVKIDTPLTRAVKISKQLTWQMNLK